MYKKPVLAAPPATQAKSKKRSREDDIPDEVKINGTLTKKFKELTAHVKCEAHKGHCHINRSGEHRRLDYKEMSFWAKQMV